MRENKGNQYAIRITEKAPEYLENSNIPIRGDPLRKMNIIIKLVAKLMSKMKHFGKLLTHCNQNLTQFINNLPRSLMICRNNLQKCLILTLILSQISL